MVPGQLSPHRLALHLDKDLIDTINRVHICDSAAVRREAGRVWRTGDIRNQSGLRPFHRGLLISPQVDRVGAPEEREHDYREPESEKQTADANGRTARKPFAGHPEIRRGGSRLLAGCLG